jgi:hypothetical protein
MLDRESLPPHGRPPIHDHIVVGKNGHAGMKGFRLN